MGFHEPHQQAHKLAGMAKAAKSSKTPAHLREHLARRAKEGMMKNTKPFGGPGSRKFDPNNSAPGGGVPGGQLMKTTNAATSEERGPDDETEFTTNSGDHASMEQNVGIQRTPPKAAGNRPASINVRAPRQGSSGRTIGSVKTAAQGGPGIQKSVAGKNLDRWQPKGKGNSYGSGAFYGW